MIIIWLDLVSLKYTKNATFDLIEFEENLKKFSMIKLKEFYSR